MRFFRLPTLMLLASLAITACSSPTASDSECEDFPDICGFPTTGN